MKKIILSILLLHGADSSAQLGTISINKKDSWPIAQPFIVQGKKYRNVWLYMDEYIYVKAYIDSILQPYNLCFNDGEIDQEFNVRWYLDHSNGYGADVTYFFDEELPLLKIETYEINETEK